MADNRKYSDIDIDSLIHQGVDSEDIGIIITDNSGYILVWNKWMEQASGKQLVDVRDKHLADVFPEMRDSRLEDAMANALERGMAGLLSAKLHREPPLRLQRLDAAGSPLTNPVIVLRPLIGSGPKRRGCLIQIIDETSSATRERVLKSQAIDIRTHEEQLRTLFEAINDSVILIDHTGIIIALNDTACLRMRGTKLAMVGTNITRYLHGPSVETYKDHVKKVLFLRSAQRFEDIIGDETYSVSMFPVPNADGTIRKIAVLVSDITDRKAFEQRITESRNFARSILDSVSSHVAVIDGSGIIIEVNAPWIRFAEDNGATDDGCGVGRNYLDICRAGAPDSLALEAADGVEAILTGRANQFVLEYPCHSPNTQRWMQMRVLPLKGPGGGAVISHDDITIQRDREEEIRTSKERLESSARLLIKSERFSRAVADNMPGMVGYWDADLHCRFANKNYIEWFGKTPDEMIGISIQELMGEQLFAVNEHLIRGALGGEYQKFERTLKKSNGDIGYTWAQYIPDFGDNGEVKGFFVLVTDITALKQTELNLKELNTHLVAARDMAEEANRAKSEFLANMSHEIRTPMNAILGLSEVLSRTALTIDQRDCVDKVLTSGRSLLNILNDILDYSKIEAGRLELECKYFSLDGVFKNIATIIGINAQQKNINITIGATPDVPIHLFGDALRLQQILINLAGNAIKFTDTGDVIINTTLINSLDDRILLKFEVRDTGIGINKETAQRLFTPFTQADSSTTRRFGGTGLGLAICYRLVTLMGGEIGVESVEGQGSSFWFTAVFMAGEEPQRVRACCSSSGFSVLVIDDNFATRTVLADTVIGLGWRCDTAESGETGLKIFEQGTSYDLILIEWRMPGMDGLQTAQIIQSKCSPTPVTIIIMVEASDRDNVASLPGSTFVTSILLKPVSASALYDLVSHHCHTMNSDFSEILPLTQPINRKLPLNGLSILVVEDNSINQDVARRILQVEGATVEVACNGVDAIQRLQTAPCNFDLVLMDIQMPLVDGYEATRRIRTELCLADLPIIALSAGVLPVDRQKALDAGINDFVGKPFDVRHLVSVVATYCGRNALDNRDVSGRKGPPAILDMVDSLARAGDNRALLRSLFGRFIEQFSSVAHAVQHFLNIGDVEEAIRVIHTLRGSAGNVGASRLADLAAKIETSLRAESCSTPSTDHGELLRLVDDTLAAIREALIVLEPEADGTHHPVLGSDIDLKELKSLLAANDIAALDIFSAIRDNLVSRGGVEAVGPIAQAIERLDFQVALKYLIEEFKHDQ